MGHDHKHEHGDCGHDHGHSHRPAPVHRHEGHGHSHAGHSHVPESASEAKLFWVMLLTGGFMLVEAVGGWLSGSLALIADAGHMVTDVASLALAWSAFRLSRRPADAQRSYGYGRLQVLAAYTNGIALLGLLVWIAVEAVLRILAPQPVAAPQMLGVAIAGLLVNIAAFWVLHRGGAENLNTRGAMLHVLGDLLGSVAAIAAALVILATGWTLADPLLSILVAGLLLRSSLTMVRQSSHILLEGTPGDMRPAAVAEVVGAVPGVADVHHIHIWSLTEDRPLLTLHARLTEGADHETVLAAINTRLKSELGIEHATVQLEPLVCASGHAAACC